MNAMAPLLLWSAVQVTLFTAAGMLLYLFVRRLGPAAGALAASALLLTTIGISASAISPWPHWFARRRRKSRRRKTRFWRRIPRPSRWRQAAMRVTPPLPCWRNRLRPIRSPALNWPAQRGADSGRNCKKAAMQTRRRKKLLIGPRCWAWSSLPAWRRLSSNSAWACLPCACYAPIPRRSTTANCGAPPTRSAGGSIAGGMSKFASRLASPLRQRSVGAARWCYCLLVGECGLPRSGASCWRMKSRT